MAKRTKTPKPFVPTGVPELDSLEGQSAVTIDDYARAASQYVLLATGLQDSPKKAAQIRLSNVLGRALKAELEARLEGIDVFAGERTVAGALRSTRADVSEIHKTDGLRLAIEIKPVNLAVGRAIWNRFGDIRTFAVNIHLKFPFCVVGGVLAIPTWEETGTRAAKKALTQESEAAAATDVNGPDGQDAMSDNVLSTSTSVAPHRSTVALIERAITRLNRAGGRRTEGDAPHLLEAIAVIVYDPDRGALSNEVPSFDSGLRWEQFVEKLVEAYRGRFEGV